jgi:hypothetical protein
VRIFFVFNGIGGTRDCVPCSFGLRLCVNGGVLAQCLRVLVSFINLCCFEDC